VDLHRAYAHTSRHAARALDAACLLVSSCSPRRLAPLGQMLPITLESPM
jgi:hypothetical protein